MRGQSRQAEEQGRRQGRKGRTVTGGWWSSVSEEVLEDERMRPDLRSRRESRATPSHLSTCSSPVMKMTCQESLLVGPAAQNQDMLFEVGTTWIEMCPSQNATLTIELCTRTRWFEVKLKHKLKLLTQQLSPTSKHQLRGVPLGERSRDRICPLSDPPPQTSYLGLASPAQYVDVVVPSIKQRGYLAFWSPRKALNLKRQVGRVS
ncbi:hypothetical protein Cadr_000004647 [Camelus dromedarius]|uniref:Uncharacterized protein n=1 Tax=Camelus dromedarius TaxID=9838 RepID=A0A5N4EDT5_CAMDR|nr:hypothetical protein Cadr_000004647 [Camelus dromedarius]